MKLDPTCRIEISRHADLKTRESGEILVLPEQAIRIGGSGGEILRLVMKEETGASVLDAMRARYSDSPDLNSEVVSFLERMLEIGGIVQFDESSSPNRPV